MEFRNVDGLRSPTVQEQIATVSAVMASITSGAHFASHSDFRRPITGARSNSDAAIVRTISGNMKTASDQVIWRPRPSSAEHAPHPAGACPERQRGGHLL